MEDTRSPRGPSARELSAMAGYTERFSTAPQGEARRAMKDIDAAMDTWLPSNAMADLFRTLNALKTNK